MFPDAEEVKRVRPFDWEREFPQVLGRPAINHRATKTSPHEWGSQPDLSGAAPQPEDLSSGAPNLQPVSAKRGFDAVIGNPPWGGDIDKELDYFHKKYPATTQEHTDSFKLFIEKGLRLARDRCLVSMIVPNTVLRQRRLKDVRALLLQNRILTLVDLGEDVFTGVVAPSCILVVEKGQTDEHNPVSLIDLGRLQDAEKPLALHNRELYSAEIAQGDFLANAELELRRAPKKHTVPITPLGEFEELECKDAGINYQRVKVGMQEKGKSGLAERLLYEGKRQKNSDKM
jgi:hypothetical protein